MLEEDPRLTSYFSRKTSPHEGSCPDRDSNPHGTTCFKMTWHIQCPATFKQKYSSSYGIMELIQANYLLSTNKLKSQQQNTLIHQQVFQTSVFTWFLITSCTLQTRWKQKPYIQFYKLSLHQLTLVFCTVSLSK